MYRYYLAFHLIAVISWMAGILYLYRLFIYHAQETEGIVKERFKVMEDRLYCIITVPAMIATLAFGFLMLTSTPLLLSKPWMHIKLFCVAGLIALTWASAIIKRQFQEGKVPLTANTLRFINELPTLLMIIIVMMVIIRPF